LKKFEVIDLQEITEIIRWLEFQTGNPDKIFRFEVSGKRYGEAGFNSEKGKWELVYYSRSNPAPVMPDVKPVRAGDKTLSDCGRVKIYFCEGRLWVEGEELPFIHSFTRHYEFIEFCRAAGYNFEGEAVLEFSEKKKPEETTKDRLQKLLPRIKEVMN